MAIRLEQPRGGELASVFNWLQGWASGPSELQLSLCLDGAALPFRSMPRLDVERVKGTFAIGFSAIIDVRTIADTADLEIAARDEVSSFKLKVTPSARSAASAWQATKQRKLARVTPLLRCPSCAVSKIGESLRCATCQTQYSRASDGFNFLSKQSAAAFGIEETPNVSHHPYPPEARALIDEVRGRNGFILDCGAGFRFDIADDIVCLEVVDYPSTDVLGIGQSLPFQDGSFDLVLSSAVLEHVTDPFLCAKEIIRVTRPGGRIFCSVPFLQPEHGYPNHYYNMSLEGLLRLFEGPAQIQDKGVADWGHPLGALAWFLSDYEKHLPVDLRERFRSLTIHELARLRHDSKDPIFSALSAEGRRVLASATFIVARKRG
jgi:SAM-dependent methyltransferase